MKIHAEFQGLNDFMSELSELPKKFQDQTLREINKEAAKITLNAMKANNQTGSKEIAESLKIRNGRGRNKTAVVVGSFAVKGEKTTWKSRWYEFGTKERETKKRFKGTGKTASRGKFSAKPFLQKSIDQTAQQVVTFVSTQYREIAEKQLKRIAKSLERKIIKLKSQL